MSATETHATAIVGTIYLRPRPLTRNSGVLKLVPLLSEPPRPTLPVETWARVLAFVFASPPATITSDERRARLRLVYVSRTFKNIVSPFFYAYPYLNSVQALAGFTARLRDGDRAWDSLRRIPYSTPGRWVHTLDLGRVACTTSAERLAVDTCLTQLVPLVPCLVRLVLNGSVRLSRRAMAALAAREDARLLRGLKGVRWDGAAAGEEPLLALVRACEGLEELEVFGPGLQEEGEDAAAAAAVTQLNTPPPSPLPPLFLPHLHSLMLLSLPRGPLVECLVRSPLPALRHLMVTPYDDVPSAQTSALVAVHGGALQTLAFHTPKTWPPSRHATAGEVLRAAPALQALSLTVPLPPLAAPRGAGRGGVGHPLRVLSLPRPDGGYLCKLEAWLYLGLLPCFEEVHMREVRWIRQGVSVRAAETGVQGEMREWQRRLARWGVRVLDVNGRENAW